MLSGPIQWGFAAGDFWKLGLFFAKTPPKGLGLVLKFVAIDRGLRPLLWGAPRLVIGLGIWSNNTPVALLQISFIFFNTQVVL